MHSVCNVCGRRGDRLLYFLCAEQEFLVGNKNEFLKFHFDGTQEPAAAVWISTRSRKPLPVFRAIHGLPPRYLLYEIASESPPPFRSMNTSANPQFQILGGRQILKGGGGNDSPAMRAMFFESVSRDAVTLVAMYHSPGVLVVETAFRSSSAGTPLPFVSTANIFDVPGIGESI